MLPGTDHVLAYHMIAKGGGWAATDGAPPVRLSTGDIVMFPRGDAHVISSAPGLRAPHTGAGWVQATAHDPKPVPVTYRGTLVEPGATLPGHEADAVVVCGFIGCDLKPFNPLIDALPRMLHVEAGSSSDWIGGVLRQAVRRVAGTHRAGSDALLERASEMVFVDAARRYLDRLPEDVRVARGLSATVTSAARSACCTRIPRLRGRSTSFPAAPACRARPCTTASRCSSAWPRCSTPRALAHRRLAAARLRAGHDTIASIALDVGYESEAAFSRAFKRLCGAAPSAWRRTDARMPPTPDAPPAGRIPR